MCVRAFRPKNVPKLVAAQDGNEVTRFCLLRVFLRALRALASHSIFPEHAAKTSQAIKVDRRILPPESFPGWNVDVVFGRQ
jgi:hypothetical protein